MRSREICSACTSPSKISESEIASRHRLMISLETYVRLSCKESKRIGSRAEPRYEKEARLTQQARDALGRVVEARVAPDQPDHVEDRREECGDLLRRGGGERLTRRGEVLKELQVVDRLLVAHLDHARELEERLEIRRLGRLEGLDDLRHARPLELLVDP